MRRRGILFVLLVITFGEAPAQVSNNVLYASAPRHIKKDSFIDFDPLIKYIFPELKDSVSLKELKTKGDKYSTYLSKPPLKFKDCIFFNCNLATFQRRQNWLETGDYSFFNIFFPIRKSILVQEPYVYPPSLRFYADTNTIKINDQIGEITVTEEPILENYIEPFYFRNYEVTNAEYREFVYWVKDSLARKLLVDSGYAKKYCIYTDKDDSSKYKLNWKQKVDWNTEDTVYRKILSNLYLKDEERFYHRRELDSRKLMYAFYPTEEENKVYKSYKEFVSVYPDTLAWVHEFSYSFFEPMTNNYFWHPAYDNFPVVGLNYFQIRAYLHWKQIMMQQELDNKGIKYRVELKLPSEIEWEIVSTATIENNSVKTYTNDSPYLWDDSWITDLRFTFRNGGTDTLVKYSDTTVNVIKSSTVKVEGLMLKDEKFFGNYYADQYFHTSESDIHKVNKKRINDQLLLNLDPLGISYMGGNVSEWMNNTMDGSWRVLFRIRQKLLSNCGFTEAKMVSSIENYYYKFDYDPAHSGASPGYKPNNARLIRGGNWCDERFSFKYSKNVAGMNAKCFIDDSGWEQDHCTVGFRYIIKVYPK